MDLFVDRMPTPVGTLFLVWQGDALRALDFGDYEDRFYRLLQVHYGKCPLTPERAPAEIRGALTSYFEGEITAIDRIPVRTNGTPFQLKVWNALRKSRRARRPHMANWPRASDTPRRAAPWVSRTARTRSGS